MPSNLGTLQPLDVSYVPMDPASEIEKNQESAVLTIPGTLRGDLNVTGVQTVYTESGSPVPSQMGVNRPGQIVVR